MIKSQTAGVSAICRPRNKPVGAVLAQVVRSGNSAGRLGQALCGCRLALRGGGGHEARCRHPDLLGDLVFPDDRLDDHRCGRDAPRDLLDCPDGGHAEWVVPAPGIELAEMDLDQPAAVVPEDAPGDPERRVDLARTQGLLVRNLGPAGGTFYLGSWLAGCRAHNGASWPRSSRGIRHPPTPA